jgi:hypothetical protein
MVYISCRRERYPYLQPGLGFNNFYQVLNAVFSNASIFSVLFDGVIYGFSDRGNQGLFDSTSVAS